MNGWIALFPGQGSQHVGMARDLAESFKVVRETLEEASDAAKFNVQKLCFDGPESDLTLTENTQPCLLAASVAAFRVARAELGFKPTVVAGHSLGEYSALVAAGSLELATAVRWVRERGRAMQKAVPAGEGAMAAILGIDDGKIAALCEKATAAAREKRAADTQHLVEAIVEPANFNSPGQIVIAGSADAVTEAVALVKAGGEFAGGKAIPLAVSAPFHCRLMKPARERMAEIFSQTGAGERPRALECPYVPNRTARPSREPGAVLDLLVDQIDHPVLWSQSVTALLESGGARAVEFGPGKVLVGLVKRIAQAQGKTVSLANVSDRAAFQTFEKAYREASA